MEWTTEIEERGREEREESEKVISGMAMAMAGFSW